ncbi:MAG: hypothetical protein E7300_09200 [Lachnospiraceae bacterium]|nr:hypothetical protein [Lachnospiraceae bacterium]
MIVSLLLITVVPFLAGTCFFAIKKNKTEFSFGETYLMGLLFLLTLGEAAACVVIKMKAPFSLFCQIVGYGALFVCVVSLINIPAFRQAMHRGRAVAKQTEEALTDKKSRAVLAVAVIVLWLIQIAACLIYDPNPVSDTMGETIWTMVLSGRVFEINPVTGSALQTGMYPLYKLASLPLFYAMLFQQAGIPMEMFLFLMIPIWVICIHMVVVYRWGSELFQTQIGKRHWFLVFYGIMLAVGDGSHVGFPYLLLHRGWTGEAMAYAFAVPFAGYMLYRTLTSEDRLYGLAGTLMGIVAFLFSRPLFVPEATSFFAGNGNRMWSVLLIGILALHLTWRAKNQIMRKREMILVVAFLVLGIYAKLPATLLGASYVCSLLNGMAMGRKQERRLAVGLILICCLSGTVLPFSSGDPKIYDIPKERREVLYKVDELASGVEKPYVWAPDALAERLRLRNGRIMLPYGKDIWQEACNREIADVYSAEEMGLWQQMQAEDADPELIAAMATDMPCNILVLGESMEHDTAIRYGWQEAACYDIGVVYTRQTE